MERLAIIDGTGFMRRAYHATLPIVDANGVANNAVDAFARLLHRIAKGGSSHRVIAAEPPGEPTWRHTLHRGYRANHPPDPIDMTTQLKLLPEMAGVFNIALAQVSGFSSRDVIASYTSAALSAGMEVVIVSSDKTLSQLFRQGVTLYCPLARALITDAAIVVRYGVPGARLVDALALIGDKEDGIPGVLGIGLKWAAELVNRHGSVVRALAMANTIKVGRLREVLMNGGPAALLSLRLVTLDDSMALPLPLAALAVNSESPNGLAAWLAERGMTAILRDAAD